MIITNDSDYYRYLTQSGRTGTARLTRKCRKAGMKNNNLSPLNTGLFLWLMALLPPVNRATTS